jgi:hypothetical protein
VSCGSRARELLRVVDLTCTCTMFMDAGIPGHLLGPGWARPGRAGPRKSLTREMVAQASLARLLGLKILSRPGPTGVFFVGPSGFRAGPSQKLPKILSRSGPSPQSGRDFAV